MTVKRRSCYTHAAGHECNNTWNGERGTGTRNSPLAAQSHRGWVMSSLHCACSPTPVGCGCPPGEPMSSEGTLAARGAADGVLNCGARGTEFFFPVPRFLLHKKFLSPSSLPIVFLSQKMAAPSSVIASLNYIQKQYLSLPRAATLGPAHCLLFGLSRWTPDVAAPQPVFSGAPRVVL